MAPCRRTAHFRIIAVSDSGQDRRRPTSACGRKAAGRHGTLHGGFRTSGIHPAGLTGAAHGLPNPVIPAQTGIPLLKRSRLGPGLRRDDGERLRVAVNPSCATPGRANISTLRCNSSHRLFVPPRTKRCTEASPSRTKARDEPRPVKHHAAGPSSGTSRLSSSYCSLRTHKPKASCAVMIHRFRAFQRRRIARLQSATRIQPFPRIPLHSKSTKIWKHDRRILGLQQNEESATEEQVESNHISQNLEDEVKPLALQMDITCIANDKHEPSIQGDIEIPHAIIECIEIAAAIGRKFQGA